MSTRTGPGMPLRGDRIHRYVNAFCPHLPRGAAGPAARGGAAAVGLAGGARRADLAGARLPTHGLVRTLYDESPEILTYLEQWTAPTKVHTPDLARQLRRRCRRRTLHGLPEMQTQHTCILLADLTDHCNLRCPTCFADSSPALAVGGAARGGAGLDRHAAVARERPHRRADALRRRADAVPAARRAARRGRRADRSCGSWSTPTGVTDRPGRRAARPAAPPPRAGRGLPAVRRRESAEASTHHRGADIRRFKERAIDRLSGARGLHHADDDRRARRQRRRDRRRDQAGPGHAVRRRGHHPAGVRLRPQRRPRPDATGSPTPACWPGSSEQTAGQVTWRDLTALPCSHPHCCSVGYLLRDDSGHVALAGRADRARPAQAVARPRARRARQPDRRRRHPRPSCAPSSRTRCSDLLSEQSSLSHPSMTDIWRDICENCDLGIGTLTTLAASSLPGQRERLRRLLGERVLRVTVKPFMDMNTMIEERLTQCCVHVATVDGDSAATSARRSAPCRPGHRSRAAASPRRSGCRWPERGPT